MKVLPGALQWMSLKTEKHVSSRRQCLRNMFGEQDEAAFWARPKWAAAQ